MPRALSSKFRDFIEASNPADVAVVFATITHPNLLEPVPVNSDVVDYVLDGVTYLGAAFAVQLVSDDEGMPRAKASIQNVDQAIGDAVQALPDSPRIDIEIYLKSDFDDSVPRNPIGSPEPEYVAALLSLKNVNCDYMMLTADLVGFDFTTEPWPWIRSTQDRLPGLYR